jgi:hypothetical protein
MIHPVRSPRHSERVRLAEEAYKKALGGGDSAQIRSAEIAYERACDGYEDEDEDAAPTGSLISRHVVKGEEEEMDDSPRGRAPQAEKKMRTATEVNPVSAASPPRSSAVAETDAAIRVLLEIRGLVGAREGETALAAVHRLVNDHAFREGHARRTVLRAEEADRDIADLRSRLELLERSAAELRAELDRRVIRWSSSAGDTEGREALRRPDSKKRKAPRT